MVFSDDGCEFDIPVIDATQITPQHTNISIDSNITPITPNTTLTSTESNATHITPAYTSTPAPSNSPSARKRRRTRKFNQEASFEASLEMQRREHKLTMESLRLDIEIKKEYLKKIKRENEDKFLPGSVCPGSSNLA